MIDNDNKIMVWLTEEQAALFILFQGHFDSIGLMMQAGVFDIEGGAAILNFDGSGALKSIKKEIYTYASKKDMHSPSSS